MVSCSILLDVLVTQSCPTVCSLMDTTRLLCPWNSPGKNTGMGCHSLLQASFQPRNWTWVSCSAGRFFTVWATREAPVLLMPSAKKKGTSVSFLWSLGNFWGEVGKATGSRCPYATVLEKAMAPHSSTLAWKIPWMEEPGGLQSMGLRRVGHNWATSLSLFTFLHWRRKWQPTAVFLPGESQGRRSLVGCRLCGRTESDTTEVT